MKVFGVCGSPRNSGNSQYALKLALEAFSSYGFEISEFLLSSKNVKMTDGSLPEELAKNPIIDDMVIAEKEMVSSEFIVITTPTYFDNITPQLKNFIDRTDPFYKSLSGKKALIIVVGQADKESWLSAVNYLKLYFEIARVEVKGALTYKAVHKGDFEKNSTAAKEIQQLVKKILQG